MRGEGGTNPPRMTSRVVEKNMFSKQVECMGKLNESIDLFKNQSDFLRMARVDEKLVKLIGLTALHFCVGEISFFSCLIAKCYGTSLKAV